VVKVTNVPRSKLTEILDNLPDVSIVDMRKV
jgi:hypothetical protein